jgi:ferritin-like metal-binding protein YciE
LGRKAPGQKALPKMQEAATSEELAMLLPDSSEATKDHVARLETGM